MIGLKRSFRLPFFLFRCIAALRRAAPGWPRRNRWQGRLTPQESFRPTLEMLEDRQLLDAAPWTLPPTLSSLLLPNNTQLVSAVSTLVNYENNFLPPGVTVQQFLSPTAFLHAEELSALSQASLPLLTDQTALRLAPGWIAELNALANVIAQVNALEGLTDPFRLAWLGQPTPAKLPGNGANALPFSVNSAVPFA